MVCPTCKAATADGAGMIADVTPAQLDAAMCDAELLGDVEREPERVRKTVTARVRRQVYARDHHRCSVRAAARRVASISTTSAFSPTWDATTSRT